jgi:hypothetical protein
MAIYTPSPSRPVNRPHGPRCTSVPLRVRQRQAAPSSGRPFPSAESCSATAMVSSAGVALAATTADHGGGGCDSDGVVAGGRSGGYRWMWLAASATSILLFILPLRNTADLQLPVPILAPIHNLQLSPQFYFVRRSSKV